MNVKLKTKSHDTLGSKGLNSVSITIPEEIGVQVTLSKEENGASVGSQVHTHVLVKTSELPDLKPETITKVVLEKLGISAEKNSTAKSVS